MSHQASFELDQTRISAIEADDGYIVKYRVWAPAEAQTRAVLVLLNGVMSHSLWFTPIAGRLVARGIKLVGADRRGSGLNTESRGDAPSGKVLLADLLAIIERERVAGRPLHLVGWCWGAVLAINLAAQIGDLASMVLLAPGLFPTREIKERMAALHEAAQSPAESTAFLRSPITEDMFTDGPALADFILRDEHRLSQLTPRLYGILMKLGVRALIQLQKLALPTLVVLAHNDRATDNEETERGVARLTAGRAEFVTIESAHGLQFDAPDVLASVLAAWTLDRKGQGP
jgi:acylglycerol lipase